MKLRLKKKQDLVYWSKFYRTSKRAIESFGDKLPEGFRYEHERFLDQLKYRNLHGDPYRKFFDYSKTRSYTIINDTPEEMAKEY